MHFPSLAPCASCYGDWLFSFLLLFFLNRYFCFLRCWRRCCPFHDCKTQFLSKSWREFHHSKRPCVLLRFHRSRERDALTKLLEKLLRIEPDVYLWTQLVGVRLWSGSLSSSQNREPPPHFLAATVNYYLLLLFLMLPSHPRPGLYETSGSAVVSVVPGVLACPFCEWAEVSTGTLVVCF